MGTMNYRMDRVNAHIEKAPDDKWRVSPRSISARLHFTAIRASSAALATMPMPDLTSASSRWPAMR